MKFKLITIILAMMLALPSAMAQTTGTKSKTTTIASSVTPDVKNYCTAVEQVSRLFENIDPNDEVMNARAESLVKEMKKLMENVDKSVVLTPADKQLLKTSHEKMYRAMVIGALKTKGNDYNTLDAATKKAIDSQLQSIISDLNKAVEESRTLGDFMKSSRML